MHQSSLLKFTEIKGSPVKAIERESKKLGVDIWYDGSFRVTSPGHPLEGEFSFLDSSCGLVGSPSVTRRGAKIKTLMIPGLKCGTLLEVHSKTTDQLQRPSFAEASGFFVIESMIVSGDSHSENMHWGYNLECTFNQKKINSSGSDTRFV